MIHEDWICANCQGHNFSRREDCYRCKKPKDEQSMIVPVVKQIQQTQKPLDLYETPDNQYKTEYKDQNCLMLRGHQIKFLKDDKEIRDKFKGFNIVEVRLVSDKQENCNKDFLFIEFISQKEAQRAFDYVQLNCPHKSCQLQTKLFLNGHPVTVSYSKGN